MALEKQMPAYSDYPESAAGGTPDTGYVRLYAKTNGKLAIKDDAGTETELGGGGGAPANATYIVQTPDGTLSNEQALSVLSTGFMKSTTGTGVVSTIADPLPIANGGTGQTSKTPAFDALSPTTTKGDLIVYDGTDNVRQAIGANGTIWTADSAQANGGKYAGGLVAIVPATTLGASQTTITLSAIPAYFQDLLLIVRVRSTGATTQINVTFNGDTGANYSIQRSSWDTAGTQTNTPSNNQNNIAVNQVAVGNTGTASYFGLMEFTIASYAKNTITRQGTWRGGAMTTATTHVRSIGSWAWEDVSNAISSIELNLAVGDFAAGTIYELYGIGTA